MATLLASSRASALTRLLTLGTTAVVTLLVTSACGRFQRVKGNEKVAADGTSLLVFGDSLSTGVFTSPKFSLAYGNLIAQAVKGERANPTGLVSPTKNQPVRIRKPEEEISQFGKGGPALAEAMLKVIEWPELSWATVLGAQQNTPNVQVVIPARNGAQAGRMSDEVASWTGDTKDGSRPRLPAEVYVFFSGDDLCRASDIQDTITPQDQYVAGIRDGVHALAAGADVNPSGTKVYLVSHLDILQQVTNPEIQSQKHISISDPSERGLTCSAFVKEHEHDEASKRPEDQLKLFTYNPMNVCYNMLAHSPGLDPADAKVPMDKLRETIDGYRKGLSQLATELQQDAQIKTANIQVKLITTTEDLKMVPDDLANDCFHLSNVGQEKLASAIAKGR